ncbi:MAG TPA: M23 family metallopeptidase [Nitrospirae bacterium]|nr:M23 family metallopeptidase [Nitrospirota bacterium]
MRFVKLFILLSLFFLSYNHVYAFEAEVVPLEIDPGDSFMVKVTGLYDSGDPEAVLDNRTLYFSRCGRGCYVAVSAIGLDTKAGKYDIRLSAGELNATLELIVRDANFPTINLTLPDNKVFLNPEDLKRAQKEAEKLKSIWKKISERLWAGNFVLPIENETSTAFGTKRIMNEKKTSIHKGVDFRGKKGEPVKAFNNGKVVIADDLFFGGNTLILDHGQGIFSIYMHLSKINVSPEDMVSKGDVVGFVGSSGRATGPHLHFGVKVQEINSNPMSFMKLDLLSVTNGNGKD